MEKHFTPSPRLADFADLLGHADRQDYGMILVLACDQNNWPVQQVNELLTETTTPVLGGIFPALSIGDEHHEQGALLLGLAEDADVARLTGMSDPDANFEEQLLGQVDQWSSLHDTGTLVVLVDGLASRISALVEGLFFVFGLQNNFVGGGAGSLSFEHKPCIITPEGLEADVAMVIKLPRASRIGVTHGWSSISDALEVTEADQNVVKSLNWEPAFEAYRSIVDAHSPTPIHREAFFDTAKSYPLGLQKLDGEIVVRDPLLVQNDSELVCVGEVPQGAFVRILNGDHSSLLNAARQARQLVATDDLDQDNDLLLFDCISRALFLGPNIEQELKELNQGEASVGAFTLGEIANSGTDYLEFLNKTTVLARIGNPDR